MSACILSAIVIVAMTPLQHYYGSKSHPIKHLTNGQEENGQDKREYQNIVFHWKHPKKDSIPN
jgi:hypothetical protein